METERKVLESIENAKKEWQEKDTLSFSLKPNQLYLSTICLDAYSHLKGAKGFYIYAPGKEKTEKVFFPFDNEKEKGKVVQKLMLFKMLTDTYADEIMVTRQEMKDAVSIDDYIDSKNQKFARLFYSCNTR